jgi:hypothetical protein
MPPIFHQWWYYMVLQYWAFHESILQNLPAMKSPGSHHLPRLGTLAPELPIFRFLRLQRLAFELGPKGKAPDPVRCSDGAPLSPPRIPLDSCHPTVLRTHRLPGAPAPLASPSASIRAMLCHATSSPSLSLSSSCAGIHPTQIATHTLSYIAIANIRNVPDN